MQFLVEVPFLEGKQKYTVYNRKALIASFVQTTALGNGGPEMSRLGDWLGAQGVTLTGCDVLLHDMTVSCLESLLWMALGKC